MAETAAEERASRMYYALYNGGDGGLVKQVQKHEGRLDVIELHHAKEGQMWEEAIRKVLSERSKSAEGIIRAIGPYFAAIVSVLVVLISTGRV